MCKRAITAVMSLATAEGPAHARREGRARRCAKCHSVIADSDLHKIVMYVVGERFTEHHYEHVECPSRFSV